jgi:hypothetical protein
MGKDAGGTRLLAAGRAHSPPAAAPPFSWSLARLSSAVLGVSQRSRARRTRQTAQRAAGTAAESHIYVATTRPALGRHAAPRCNEGGTQRARPSKLRLCGAGGRQRQRRLADAPRANGVERVRELRLEQHARLAVPFGQRQLLQRASEAYLCLWPFLVSSRRCGPCVTQRIQAHGPAATLQRRTVQRGRVLSE